VLGLQAIDSLQIDLLGGRGATPYISDVRREGHSKSVIQTR